MLLAPVKPPRADVGLQWRVSPDGKDVVPVDLTTLSGFQSASLIEATLSSGGDVALLVAVPEKKDQSQRFVLTFDRKGRLKSKAKLDDIRATRFAIFDSGKYELRRARPH